VIKKNIRERKADYKSSIEPIGGFTMHVKPLTVVTPLADRVVVKPLEEQEIKKGGIIIPDTAKEKPMQGEIIEVGPGRMTDEGKRLPLEVKKGDRVLYGKYSGTEVSIEGEELLIMRESDIFAIIQSRS
jgi:chaperonin GroES